MKTFLKSSVLLVSLGALASSTDPAIYQYWFDNDETSRIGNTHIYDAESNSLSVDASALGPGGHAVRYRMADKDNRWGNVLTRYFVVPPQDGDSRDNEGDVPVIYQYWFDNDESKRKTNTFVYDSESNSMTIDADGLRAGGHALNYRMANKGSEWGSVLTRYFTVPGTPDSSSSTPKAYRVLLNNEVVSIGEIPTEDPFTVLPDFPENPLLNYVDTRSFKYLKGENKVNMDATGTFSCAIQMLSDAGEWGAPVYSDNSSTVSTKLPIDSVPVPYDFTFSKPNLNNFQAYRFYNGDKSCLYFKASQDCDVSLFYVYTGYESNLDGIRTFSLKKGETYRLESSYLNDRELVAVVYNTPTNKQNPDENVFLRIMYEDNQVPEPVISLDSETWELRISCADQRATIFYTLDGTDPSYSSPVYTGPIKLEKFTRVKAFASYGDLASSTVKDISFTDSQMRIPRPELAYAGGLGMNEFVLKNRVEGVTIYYRLDDESFDDEVGRYEFDGNPFIIPDGSYLKAYCVKDMLADSEVMSMWVYHGNYITDSPNIYDSRTEGEDYEYWSDRKHYMSLSVPNGQAYYRFVPGLQEFGEGDKIEDGQWNLYNPETNDGWIEIPGGAFGGNQTIQMYAESEGKARSAVRSVYTDWIQAKQPKVEYNNYMLKFSTDVPGGVVKYNFGYFDDSSALAYSSEELPDGIDVHEQWLVSARVVAPGYANSNEVQINRDSYNIDSPSIYFKDEDGYLHIEHPDEEATLVVTTEPWQNPEQISKNHVRLMPEYNVVVNAYATKWGRNDSPVAERRPIDKPEVNVDGYRVNMWHPYAEIFYTLNGEKPVREQNDSNFYYKGEFYLDHATKIRAVAFCDNEIPAEADMAYVLDQTEMPELVFNYSATANEDGSLEKKKVKFTCSTPGSTIWYSLDRSISDSNRIKYDPSTEWDGIDVTGVDYIYAYAEADGFRRSEQLSRNTSGGYLSEPNMSIEDGVLEIWHDDKTVELKPAFRQEGQDWDYTPEDYNYDRENNRITCTPLYNTTVKVKVEKQGYVSSPIREMTPISKPRINVDGNRVNIEYYWDEIYYTLDGTMPTKSSKRYEGEFETKACTVRAVKFETHGIPSEAVPTKVLDRAEAPQVTFNFDRSKEQQKIKLSSNTPNAKIYYTLDESLYDEYKKLYDPNETPDGIDVTGKTYLYAYTEADGYRRSDEIFRYMSDGILPQPGISVINYGEVEIFHDDVSLTIVPEFYDQIRNEKYTPEDFAYTHNEETNKVTATVRPGTVVKAYTTKWGYYDSPVSDRSPFYTPNINVDGYYVWIDSYYGDVYYTLDGSTPTRESKIYENGFDAPACTVRAVCFVENEIPGEATPAKVMDQVATPEIVYNYSNAVVEGEEGAEPQVVEVKKVKFSCSTPNARIYYSLGRSINENTKKLYDPTVDTEGVDVSEYSNIYAFAEADGYRRSETVQGYTSNGYLSTPDYSVKDYGLVEIWSYEPAATIVPTFDPWQEPTIVKDSESNKISFRVQPGTTVRAHMEKTGCFSSRDIEIRPIQKPSIMVDGNSVSFNYDYWMDEIYYTLDGTTPTRESTLYDGNPFEAPVCTVKAVAFRTDGIPNQADPVQVLAQVETPTVVYDFDRTSDRRNVKLRCATADAKIYYSLDRGLSETTRKLYDATVDTLDVKDKSYIYLYAEKDGFRRSEEHFQYINDAYLNIPSIKVDGLAVEITSEDPSVTIVPVFYKGTAANAYEPEDMVYVHEGDVNKITATVDFNTTVKAHTERKGYYASSDQEVNPLEKPNIVVNDYNVYIDYPYWGEVFYTTDGTVPSQLSIPYVGSFNSEACTIRAAAFADGNIPSLSDPAKVMDPAAKPEIDIDNGFAKLSSTTPGAVIWYSLDQGIGAGTRKLYDPAELPDGIDISNVNTIYSYAEADGYRQSETLNFYKGEFTLEAPSLEYANGYVTAEHDDDEVVIRFSDGDGNALQAEADDSRKVKAEYNKSVVAYAYRKGYVNSRSVQVKNTTAPTITANLFDITIKGKSGQTLRYTTDGSQPTASSKEYDGPFHVTQSCTVRAAAFVDEQIPSEATALSITYRKSNKPAVASYDGRYLTLSAEEGSTVRYQFDANASVKDTGTVADGKIDMQGIRTVRAMALRSDADDSDVFSFTPEYYADDSQVYTSKAGVLKDAFAWCPDRSGYTSLAVNGVLLGSEEEDNGDYEFLRSFPALRHIDLSNVTDETVPSGALNSKTLVSAVLPSTLKSTGEFIFGQDNRTLCAVELPGTGFAPQHVLDGVKNPNLLLYAKSANLVSDLIAATDGVVKNVVVLGTGNSNSRAENITLTHADAFYAPKEFNAQKINFSREFTKQTQIGGLGSGWETMVVPFDVQTIVCAGKTLKPFGEADTDRGECPFWLYSADEAYWNPSYSIMANTPYLIAMPNNPLYSDEFVVNGKVTFSSGNVTVPVTPEEEEMSFSFGTGRYITGNYGLIDKEEEVLAINDETVSHAGHDFKPGGIFVAGQKDVVPFECYVTSHGVSAMPVFDQSEIEEIMGDYGIRIWGENYSIMIRSSISMKVRIYDTVGQLIRSVDVKAGETVRVDDITPGIYFVGTTKILVKG